MATKPQTSRTSEARTLNVRIDRSGMHVDPVELLLSDRFRSYLDEMQRKPDARTTELIARLRNLDPVER